MSQALVCGLLHGDTQSWATTSTVEMECFHRPSEFPWPPPPRVQDADLISPVPSRWHQAARSPLEMASVTHHGAFKYHCVCGPSLTLTVEGGPEPRDRAAAQSRKMKEADVP